MLTAPLLTRGLALLSILSALSACSSAKLKAPAIATSSFLQAEPPLTTQRKVSPFLLSGGSPVTDLPSLYVAPVQLSQLRSPSKYLAQGVDGAERQAEVAMLAEYARQQFILAFRQSPQPRYQIVDKPSRSTLKLELAITELNQNTFTGSLGRFALNAVAVPGTDVVIAKATRCMKGNIAIEGKATHGRTKKVVYQFADNEESRSAVVLPVIDFMTYGQARQAIKAWAQQFEQVTRTQPGQRVKDSPVLSWY
jgi:hypothetical protein